MMSIFGFVLFFDELFFRIHFRHFDYDAYKFRCLSISKKTNNFLAEREKVLFLLVVLSIVLVETETALT